MTTSIATTTATTEVTTTPMDFTQLTPRQLRLAGEELTNLTAEEQASAVDHLDQQLDTVDAYDRRQIVFGIMNGLELGSPVRSMLFRIA